MIEIYLNGEARNVDEHISVESLLERFGLPRQRVAVELNRSVIRRDDWATTNLNHGDAVEVIHFVGGG